MKRKSTLLLQRIIIISGFLFLNDSYLMAQSSSSTPGMPEVCSFEPSNATDMVNLATGDFAYVLPLMNIPSPEGGFPLSLAYHAGIQMDEDASWVGLGWNLNPGCITRGISGMPDDWNGGTIQNLFYDAGASNTYYNVGVSAEIYESISVGVSVFWGTNRSLGGAVSMGVALGGQGSPFSATVGVSTEGEVTAGVGMILGSDGGVGVGVGISSKYGVSAGVGFGVSGTSAGIGLELGYDGNVSVGISSSVGDISLSSSSMGNSPALVNVISNGIYVPFGYGSLSYRQTEVRYHYADKKNILSYGTLYPDYARRDWPDTDWGKQTNDVDVDVYSNPYDANNYQNESDFTKLNCLSFPAYDSYSVMSEGLSGVMTPRIFKRGALTQRSEILSWRSNNDIGFLLARYNNASLQELHTAYGEEYFVKPEFMFDGENNSFQKVNSGNFYPTKYMPQGQTTANTIQDPIWNLNYTGGGTIFTYQGMSNYNYAIGKNSGGKFIQYFTNREIANGNIRDLNTSNPLPKQRGFIDYAPIVGLRNDQSKFDSSGIGGFSITKEDGMTYHYALPVYQYEQMFKNIANIANPTDRFFKQNRLNKYAYTWLLTAITGPDFIDRNSNGLADKGDWGNWVVLDYGMWSDGYVWRSPYTGFTNEGSFVFGRKQVYYLNSIETRSHTAYFIKEIAEDGKSSSIFESGPIESTSTSIYERGWGYLSYLPDYLEISNIDNHTLIYSKDFASLGYTLQFQFDLIAHENLIITQNQKPLKLNKIILVNNDCAKPSYTSSMPSHVMGGSFSLYDDLTVYGRYDDPPTYWYNPVVLRRSNGNTSFYVNEYNNVLDVSDNISSIENNALETIEFNQDYTLCGNSPNSTNGFKRALREVVIKGKNNIQAVPSYKFDYYNEYGSTDPSEPILNNSPFQKDKWGNYKNHEWAWSLKEVTTPIGSKIKVNYASDTYYREAVSDKSVNLGASDLVKPSTTEVQLTINNYVNGAIVNLEDYFDIGKNYEFSYKVTAPAPVGTIWDLHYQLTLLSYDLSTNIFTFSIYDPNESVQPNSICLPFCEHHLSVKGIYEGNYTGGGVAVSSIEVSNGSELQAKTTYSYTNPANNLSSGITTYSPESPGKFIPYINEIPGPQVVYEYVTVSKTDIRDGTPGSSKVYHFNPIQVLSANGTEIGNDQFRVTDNQKLVNIPYVDPGSSGTGNFDHTGDFNGRSSTITNNFSSIGRLLGLSEYDKKGDLINNVKLTYYSNNELVGGTVQETFTETKNYEQFLNGSETVNHWMATSMSRCNYPNVLKSVTSSSKGISTTTTYGDKSKPNNGFDFRTGEPLLTSYTSSTNEYMTEIQPAYKQYSQMGSKVDNINNKNMLSQTAYFKSYVKNTINGAWNVLSASAQTWNNNWSYREYSDANDKFVDNSYNDVWRKWQNFSWKSLINDDGTISNFQDFNGWSSGNTNSKWVITGETSKYDHYSHPLQGKDISGLVSATKYGNDNSLIYASAGNTCYTGFAYSGAEDLVKNSSGNGTDYFGGEVKGAWNRYLGNSHTGDYSLRLIEGAYGFSYGGSVGDWTKDFQSGKTYRTSVWVYDNRNGTTESQNLLTVELRDKTTSSDTEIDKLTCSYSNTQVKKFGNWYLFTIDIDLNTSLTGPGGSYATINFLKVYCHNPNSTGSNITFYFDDFRIHGVNSPMSSYVYDQHTGNVTYILDNENIATKFVYDNAGRLVSTWKETPSGFKKVSESKYHYARSPH